jgi:hypothetical protein
MTHRVVKISCLMLLAACNPDKGDTEAASTSGDASSGETLGMSSSPTTGDVPATSTSTTLMTDTRGSESEVGSDVSSDPDTGESETGSSDVCQAFCDKGSRCGEEPGGAQCTTFCMESVLGPEPCAPAFTALIECAAGMTCEEYLALIEDEEPGSCAAEFAAQMKACAGNECTVSVGGDDRGMECEYTRSCPDTQEVSMSCDLTTCTCFVGPDEVAMCDAEGVCLDFDALEATVAECCGF